MCFSLQLHIPGHHRKLSLSSTSSNLITNLRSISDSHIPTLDSESSISQSRSVSSGWAEFMSKSRVVSDPLPRGTKPLVEKSNLGVGKTKKTKKKKKKVMPEREKEILSWDKLEGKYQGEGAKDVSD